MGLEKTGSSHTLIPGLGSSRPLIFKEPSIEEQTNIPLVSLASVRSAFTPSVSKLSACQAAQYSCVFSQTHGWVSKNQILWTHTVQTCADLPGEGLAMLLPFARLSQKISHMTTEWFRVYDEMQQKATTKVRCPQPVSLFLC